MKTRVHVWRGLWFVLSGTLLLFTAEAAAMIFEEKLIFHPTRYPAGDWQTQDRQPCAIEEVELKTQDGVRLHAWFLKREDTSRILIYFHGNAGHIADRYDWGCALTNVPASVLMVDYRGYGKSEGSPDEAGVYLDAEAAWNFAREKKQAQTENIWLYGKSLGGAAATHLARHHTAGALVLQSTFTSIPDMADQLMSWVPQFLVRTQMANVKNLPQIQTPTMVIHSKSDDLIPFSMGESLYQAAANPYAFLTFDGYGHNDLVSARGEEIVKAMGKMAEQISEPASLPLEKTSSTPPVPQIQE
jgi:uncharacterized protein